MRSLRGPDWDVRLALALLALGQVEVWLVGNLNGPKVVLAPAMVAMTLSLAWRRRAPLIPLLAVAVSFGGSMVAFSLSDDWPGQPESFSMLTVWVVTAYSAAAYGSKAVAIAGLLIMAAMPGVRAGLDPELDWEPLSSLFVLIPWGAGLAIGRHRRQAAELRKLAQELEREREERARAAVAEERTRIARELHDVVAHSVSVIAVQADAAEAALVRDPARSQAPLAAIKSTAREALVEMRRLLGMLRGAETEHALTPQPGMRDMEALLEQVRRTGLTLDVAIDGEPRRLPPGVDLSAYRIVQEGLTNVRKHASASRARVEIHYGEAALDVAVIDDGTEPGGNGDGHGLVGIRERVALLGGSLQAGKWEGGGYELRAHLPIDPSLS